MKLTERSAQWMATVLANSVKNTGHPFEYWVQRAKKAKVADFKSARDWARQQGLSIVYATGVAQTLFRTLDEQDEALVDAQFAGSKAALRPIYEALIKAVQRLGDDVRIMPRKTQVTCAREQTFAILRAATKDRIEVALMLRGTEGTERLRKNFQATGSDPSHVVRLSSLKEVDRELARWLRAAYDRASPNN